MSLIGRRGFLASAAGASLLAHGSNGASARLVADRPSGPGWKTTQAGNLLTLTKGTQSWTFDLQSGSIKRFGCQSDPKGVEIAPDAAAPLRVSLSDRDGKNSIDLPVCQAVKRELAWELWQDGDRLLLVFTWPNLMANEEKTGVFLQQSYLLTPADPALRLQTTLVNRGNRWVTGLFLGLEKIALNPDPGKERLLVGDVAGKPYVDPRRSLKEGKAYVAIPAGRRSFSVPPTVPAGLIVTWMDFADGGHGIGTGYANAQEMDLVGHVAGHANGLDLGWRLLRLEGSRGFMWGYNGEQQIYGLAPGEHFDSDTWFLLGHSGDWHETARAYRSCYEAAFGPDFLNWERTSPVVKENDIIINTFAAWGSSPKDKGKAYDYPNGYVINRFEDLAPKIEAAIKTLGAAPGNVLVNVLGTATSWGIYKMPDHFPMNAEAGGQAAAAEMCRKLNALGVGGLCFYAHPYFMHREAKNYVAKADTGWNYPHMDWHTSMGGIACMGSDEWIEMWRKEIYPKFAEMGITALYFDEGFGHQFICQRLDHSHGSSALALLTAQSRGASRLYRAWREAAGPKAYSACESGSDVQARLIDLWDFGAPTPIMRFTHPDKLIMARLRPKEIKASIGHAFIMGCPVLIAPLPGPFGSTPELLEGERLEGLRRFLELRREMRSKQAPGYPYSFKDDVGLTEVPPGLLAKVYADGRGLTVAYYAEQPVRGRLVIQADRLGLPALRRVVREVEAPAKEMGYLVAQAT